MADIAIKVDNIAKRYRLGEKVSANDSIIKDILKAVKSPITNFKKYRSLYVFDDLDDSDDILWALRDISFEVKQGEVVGIIGHNGAGKSTLLKILSKITPPSTGKIELRGRISSLLEVGTGFHPELTGRENLYLNGTILGMSKAEVERKFEEIVEFSGVGKFLDTPVKRYSSGMRVRLAFAVAAHLEPEILIIDEVLAVGDAEFQRKCLSKMEDVGKEGRTVLFVSHNMPAISRLCTRAILLNGGMIEKDGSVHDVVSDYLSSGTGTSAAREWPDPKTAPRGEIVRLRSVRIKTKQGETTDYVDISDPVGIEMEYEVIQSGYILCPNFYLNNDEGVIVFGVLDHDPTWKKTPRNVGVYKSTVWIPGNTLAEGMLYVDCNMITLNPNISQFGQPQVIAFHVVEKENSTDSARGDYTGKFPGVMRPLLQWETESI